MANIPLPAVPRIKGAQTPLEIPDTDPQDFGRLWAVVHAYNNITDGHDPFADHFEVATPEDDYSFRPRQRTRQDSEEDMAESDGDISFMSSDSDLLRVNCEDFRSTVLSPRKIVISGKGENRDPFGHFGTVRSEDGDHVRHYRGIRGLEETNLWLEPTSEFQGLVTQAYDAMAYQAENDGDFMAFAQRHLFRTEEPQKRRWTDRVQFAEAKTRMSYKPREDWDIPPTLDPDAGRISEYNWSDICPDVSYWLGDHAFNPSYRRLVRDHCLVEQRRFLAPYLSVDIRSNPRSHEKVMVQMACAASIAVYNRFALKDRALQARSRLWTEQDKENLRHYALIMEGKEFSLWVMAANVTCSGEWNGASMNFLMQGCFTDDDENLGFRDFVYWLNEIHRWGLTVHGASVERDIKSLLKSCEVDVSDSCVDKGAP